MARNIPTTPKTTVSTPVRNSPVPKVAAKPTAAKVVAAAATKASPAAKAVTRDMIAQRAYEIFLSGNGGSEVDNWLRAEAELRSV